MSKISGTNVAAGIVPFDTADTYPTHSATFGKGGWRSVSTLEARDAIPATRLEDGSIVFVMENSKAYLYAASVFTEWATLIFATQQDIIDGTSTTKIITPSALAGVLATKANTDDVNSALDQKADLLSVNSALSQKADAAVTATALGLKANTAEVTASLATKADTSTVNDALVLKADAAAVSASLGTKADATSLLAKADTDAVNTALSTKAEASDLDIATISMATGLINLQAAFIDRLGFK